MVRSLAYVWLALAAFGSVLLLAAVARATTDGGGRLEVVAGDPRRGTDRAEVDALASEADAMSDSAARVAIDMFVGEAYRGRLSLPDRAERHLRRAIASPAADALTRRLAQGALVDVSITQRRPREAVELAAASGDPALIARARVALRRSRIHDASVAGLAVYVALAIVALVRAGRAKKLRPAMTTLRRFVQSALFFGAWLGGAGALLARAYDGADATPFVRLALLAVPLVILARTWAAVGASSAKARAGRALLAGQAALAAAFLALESVDPWMLGGFGL